MNQSGVNDASFVPSTPVFDPLALSFADALGFEGSFNLDPFVPTGFGDVGTALQGGGAADVLDGTEFSDYLFGGGGNDVLNGFGGFDNLIGGFGNDVINGGSGDDFLDGLEGDDVLRGGDGSDTLLGLTGDDQLFGGAGVDFLEGEEDNDLLDGGAGFDFMDGGSGDDVLVFDPAGRFGTFGGAGSDTLRVDGAGITVDLPAIPNGEIGGIEIIDLTGSGNNSLLLTTTDVTALNSTSTLRVDGNAGDSVTTETGWTQGTSTLIGGVTYDVYTKGGATLQIAQAIDQTKVNDATFVPSTATSSAGIDTPFFTPDFDPETTAEGGAGDDVLDGTADSDSLFGGDGDDTLNGLGGDDFLDGWTGNDVLNGGDGNDTLLGLTGDDQLFGGAGNDLLEGEEDNDTLVGGPGNDLLAGGPGNDTLYWDVNDTFGTHGGSGTDTLFVGTTGTTVDLTAKPDSQMSSIEVIDLAGGGNTLNLAVNDVGAISSNNVLRVTGGSGDTVTTDSGWTNAGTVTIAGQAHTQYTNSGRTLNIENDVGQSGVNTSGGSSGGAITLSIADATGSESSGTASFVVTRSGDSTTSVSVSYATSGFTATSGTDFTAASGTLTFAAGETSKTISVSITNDNVFEPVEHFVVTLTNPSSSATISNATGFGKITNNHSDIVASKDLREMADGSEGFIIHGQDGSDEAGLALSAIGDFNNDGVVDFLIGAHDAEGGGNKRGESYVIFGSTNLGSSGAVSITTFNGTNGFQMNGVTDFDESGRALGGGVDINGDGVSDLIIGAYYADYNATNAGAAYLVFGGSSVGSGGSLSLSALNGTTGYRLKGESVGDRAGYSINLVGDINGDGKGDIIIGAYLNDAGGTDKGRAYVVFGGSHLATLDASDGTTDGSINLSKITTGDGSHGSVFNGVADYDYSGFAVSAAGDINGDGFADLLIGGKKIDTGGSNAGATYLVFGKSGGFGSAAVGLNSLNGTTGYIINGTNAGDYAGSSVSNIGDINGDGTDDILIGAYGADPGGASQAGSAYVIFGGSSKLAGLDAADGTTDGSIDVANLNGNNGFVVNGITADDKFATFVGNAGDLNGDGTNDLAFGAFGGDPHSQSSAGETYVVFGGSSVGSSGTITLSTLNGTDGIRFDGDDSSDSSGRTVVGAGDVNNDGKSDLLVSIHGGDGGGSGSGGVMVLFGGTDFAKDTRPNADVGSLNGANGFKLTGASASDASGRAVGAAGDVNGDGYEDFLVGARSAEGGGNSRGAAYVIFGGPTVGSGTTIDLSSLNGTTGFKIHGSADYDYLGISVRGGGDVNGDGLADIVVGAYGADYGGTNGRGESYVIFGKASFAATFTVSDSMSTSDGFLLRGGVGFDYSGRSVSLAGDLNGDGYDDVLVGAASADPNGSSSGQAYLVFGGSSATANVTLTGLNATTGYIFNGETASDLLGVSVSNAGDVNGDGIDDLLIGARLADPVSASEGEAYLVFGGSANLAALDAADGTTDGKIEVTNLNGSRGYRIEGSDNAGQLGTSVSSAGDINGDGIADFVLGAPRADPSTVADVGEAYFVFGATSNLGNLDAADGSTNGTISVSNLNGTTGFKVTGLFASDFLGGSVSHAGDVNGDGIDDVIIGTYKLEGSVRDGATADQYVLFGSSTIGSSGSIDLSTLDGSSGIVISGVNGQNYYGGIVSAAGDVNGDGFDDLMVGEHQADDSAANAGTSYVIFGGDFSGVVTDIGGTGDDSLIGTSANDYQVGDTGNDTMTGGGGVDVQLGGAGNDILGISDTNFRRVDGGSNASSGADTLRLDGNGMALNLTTIADTKILGIEKIDATGSGNNTITLKLSDVLNISDTTNTLLIVGDPGDSVVIDDGGTSLTTGTTIVDSVTYTSYTATGSDMILLVEQEMTKSVI